MKDTDTIHCHQQVAKERRQQIARYVYDVWTRCGSDMSGFAEPVLIDHRLDTLSNYVMEYYLDNDFSNKSNDMTKCCHTNTIDCVHAIDLSYTDFCERYMYPNIPVVIRGLADAWTCTNNWVMNSSSPYCKDNNNDIEIPHLVPNIQYIQQQYGTDIVSIHYQSKVGGFQYPQQRPDVNVVSQQDMTVEDYITWWEENQHNNYINCESLLYLKDWKFVLHHPKEEIYTCPNFFCDDWLNECKNGAYKFIYLGPKGTVTPLHADVLRSFSWSTNICGKKLWYFIPPQYVHLLYDIFGTKLAYHIHADIIQTKNIPDDGVDSKQQRSNDFMSILYPGLRFVRKYCISIVQECGETIFVPSNWFHTVENIADTLSINHNWLNASNIRTSWQYVETKLRKSESSMGIQTMIDDNNIELKVDDDVLLLADIAITKAKTILVNNKMQKLIPIKDIVDIEAILYVFDRIALLVQNGFGRSIGMNILDEIQSVRKHLTKTFLI